MPSLFAGEEDTDVQTLEVTLKDLYDEIYVTLRYGIFEQSDVITRSAVIENRGDFVLELKSAMSMNLDFLGGNPDLIHFYGKHTGERQFERTDLLHGISGISSTRGISSHQHNPFAILCSKDATEEHGDCWTVSLLYSGSFKIQTERDQLDGIRIICGLHDQEFCWPLEKGESFETPEAVLAFSDSGLSCLSHTLHEAYQRHLIRGPWKNQRRPILVNNWEATYFDFNADKLLAIAKQASALGMDMMVLDDGWFGKRDDDNSGLGDWEVNEKKLGCTLGELADRIHGLGLKFGIWIEPEMISEDSDLYREHPDWAFTVPGRDPVRGRNQLVLDLTRAEVREYVKGCIEKLLDSADIQYVKWDMNRTVDNVFSHAAPDASQGALMHRYVLGVYELLEAMLAKQPDLLLEGCCGGGGRFDAGMLYYSPQIWCSDNTDAIERLRIHYGTSFGYPMSAVSAHVSACPNHQNHRETPFTTRGICAMQGAFGYELDLGRLSENEKECVKEQIRIYKENWELFQQGTYYRLSSPFEEKDFTAWSYVSKDASRAVLSAVYTDLRSNARPLRVRFRGLDAGAIYDVEGVHCTGASLMNGGYVLPLPSCNYDAHMVIIRQI
jgi:alpha-galactosidase